MAVTGGVFAYGYLTNTTTLCVTSAGGDFASVTANTSDCPTWTPWGMFKGSTGSGTLFDIDTETVNYTGDLVATLSLANADDLVTAYRVLAMFIEVRDHANNLVDINGDGTANATNDYALLSLRNGAVDLFINQTTADHYTVKLKSGYYSSHIWGTGAWAAKVAPQLYIDVGQR